jgi:hypothetical protein
MYCLLATIPYMRTHVRYVLLATIYLIRGRMLAAKHICVRVCYCIFHASAYATVYIYDACSLLYTYASAYATCIFLGGSLRMYGSIRGRICIVGSVRPFAEGEDLTVYV